MTHDTWFTIRYGMYIRIAINSMWSNVIWILTSDIGVYLVLAFDYRTYFYEKTSSKYVLYLSKFYNDNNVRTWLVPLDQTKISSFWREFQEVNSEKLWSMSLIQQGQMLTITGALFFQIFKMLGYSTFIHAFKKISSEHELWITCDSFVEKYLLILLVISFWKTINP